MQDMLVETLVVSFVMGGILGAITALHLSNPRQKARVKAKSEDQRKR